MTFSRADADPPSACHLPRFVEEAPPVQLQLVGNFWGKYAKTTPLPGSAK